MINNVGNHPNLNNEVLTSGIRAAIYNYANPAERLATVTQTDLEARNAVTAKEAQIAARTNDAARLRVVGGEAYTVAKSQLAMRQAELTGLQQTAALAARNLVSATAQAAAVEIMCIATKPQKVCFRATQSLMGRVRSVSRNLCLPARQRATLHKIISEPPAPPLLQKFETTTLCASPALL